MTLAMLPRLLLLLLLLESARALACFSEMRIAAGFRPHPNGEIISNRDTPEYVIHVGPDFPVVRAKLKKEQHWFDGGTGRAGAVIDFLEATKLGEAPFVTGSGLSLPNDRNLQTALARYLNFIFLVGNLAYYEISLIKPADLVTDVYGAATYEDEMKNVVDNECKIAKKGANLFWAIPVQHKETQLLHLRDQDGKPVDITEWFRAARGLRVVKVTPFDRHGYQGFGIWAEKIADDVVFWDMKNEAREDHVPPIRHFRVTRP